MTNNELLSSVLQTAELHADRLRFAKEKLQARFPFSEKDFEFLQEEEVYPFELFSSRFAKLQDLMGSKLFGLILEYSEEPLPPESFRDKLNVLEKLRLIPSANDWLELRDTRNHLSHEYPENPELTAKYFNQAFEQSDYLLQCLDNLKKFVEKR